jgi:hypothetical protein
MCLVLPISTYDFCNHEHNNVARIVNGQNSTTSIGKLGAFSYYRNHQGAPSQPKRSMRLLSTDSTITAAFCNSNTSSGIKSTLILPESTGISKITLIDCLRDYRNPDFESMTYINCTSMTCRLLRAPFDVSDRTSVSWSHSGTQ